MKISLKEARKRATPGDLVVTPDGFLDDEHGASLQLADVDLDPMCTDVEKANAALLAHCWNHFDDLIEALDDALFGETGKWADAARAVLQRAREVEMP